MVPVTIATTIILCSVNASPWCCYNMSCKMGRLLDILMWSHGILMLLDILYIWFWPYRWSVRLWKLVLLGRVRPYKLQNYDDRLDVSIFLNEILNLNRLYVLWWVSKWSCLVLYMCVYMDHHCILHIIRRLEWPIFLTVVPSQKISTISSTVKPISEIGILLTVHFTSAKLTLTCIPSGKLTLTDTRQANLYFPDKLVLTVYFWRWHVRTYFPDGISFISDGI